MPWAFSSSSCSCTAAAYERTTCICFCAAAAYERTTCICFCAAAAYERTTCICFCAAAAYKRTTCVCFCAAAAYEQTTCMTKHCHAAKCTSRYIHNMTRNTYCTRLITRVGQNHVYTVYIRYFWQGNHQIYGLIRCIYTVLANPTHYSLIRLRSQFLFATQGSHCQLQSGK